jgi:hypothetical protein
MSNPMETEAMGRVTVEATIENVEDLFASGETTDYWPVRLTILGRSCTMAVKEVADDLPASIGRLALTCLDLVVDPIHHTLIGNPAHGGEQILEMYYDSSDLAFPTAAEFHPRNPIA